MDFKEFRSRVEHVRIERVIDTESGMVVVSTPGSLHEGSNWIFIKNDGAKIRVGFDKVLAITHEGIWVGREIIVRFVDLDDFEIED